MLKRLRYKLLHHLQLPESWLIFFIMGIIMMNFPFMSIFNKPETIFGFPLLFLYFFLGWPFSIFVIYLFTLTVGNTDDKHQEPR
ncbi:MAG: hypothetical protein CXR30_01280 [Geobacter sp.]|nr:MAG: hypothetical protein CXR30_01280 [Geobacter sp.]